MQLSGYDCVRCGACCFSERSDWIAVFEVDYARMDDRARALTVAAGAQRFMRFERGRCAALEVDEAAQSYRCSIYQARPDACRWLAPGSGECQRLIALRLAQ